MKIITEQQLDAIIAVGCESCFETAAIAASNNITILPTVMVTNFIIKLYRLFRGFTLLSFFSKEN